ncbi:MAG: hypothetical protein R2811_13850 [Flavobacteriales bacterium]
MLIIALSALPKDGIGQWITALDVHHSACDSLSVSVVVFFPFGYGGTCPGLQGQAHTSEAGLTTVDLYYDISGPWPQVGCTTSDEVQVTLPVGTDIVRVDTYGIMDGDTSEVVSDTLLTSCATGLDHIGRFEAPLFSISGDLIRWPLDRSAIHGTVDIISSTGALQRATPACVGQVYIGDLTPGVYVISYSEARGHASMSFLVGGP